MESSSSQSTHAAPETEDVELVTDAHAADEADAPPSQTPNAVPAAAVVVRKRTCVAGSRPLDNAKRDAIEAKKILRR